MNAQVKKNILRCFMVACLWSCGSFPDSELCAQSKAKLANELMEFLGRQFGREVSEIGTESLATKVESFLIKYGDDGAGALRKVGPRSIQLVEDAAAGGAMSAKLLAKYGDPAIWVVGNESRRSMAARLGEEAAEAMMKHGEIAEPILKVAERSAANALCAVSEQNGRRIAMMVEQGDFAKIARPTEVLDVVGKYGDKAMEFIWKNKGTLVLGSAVAAFLVDPEPFIDGSRQLADVAAKAAIEPIAKEIGSQTNWTITVIALMICFFAFMITKQWIRKLKSR
jgi:hypothetical protein